MDGVIDPELLFVFIILAAILAAGLFCAIFFPIYAAVNRKYRNFVNENSKALNELRKLNKQYSFYGIKLSQIEHTYDSEVNYDSVSCYDFAVGYINDYFNGIKTNLQKTEVNASLFPKY